jgi:hypothetical protein
MSLPKSSAAYPPALLQAIELGYSSGEFRIPCENPAALRLQFNGLRGALRRENSAGKIDALGFYVQKQPPALILRLRTTDPLAIAVDSAVQSAILTDPSLDAAAAAAEEAFFTRKIP